MHHQRATNVPPTSSQSTINLPQLTYDYLRLPTTSHDPGVTKVRCSLSRFHCSENQQVSILNQHQHQHQQEQQQQQQQQQQLLSRRNLLIWQQNMPIETSPLGVAGWTLDHQNLSSFKSTYWQSENFNGNVKMSFIQLKITNQHK